MIQDIAPHTYSVEYDTREPQAGDYGLYFEGKNVLLRAEKDGYRLPLLEELLKDGVTVGGWENAEEMGKHAHFLFSVDGAGYFLIEDKFVPGRRNAASGGGSFLAEGYELAPTQVFRTMRPMYQAFAGITASQLWRWEKSRTFCGVCGTRMERSKTERALVCPVCGQLEYPKISPAVIIAITNGDKLLMSKYAGRGAYKGYALIAGFVEIGETFEDTVRREVMEEVGLKVKNIRYYKSQPWAFTDTVMIGFFAELDGDDKITLQEDELAMAGWYTRDEIPDDAGEISVGSEMKRVFKEGKDSLIFNREDSQ